MRVPLSWLSSFVPLDVSSSKPDDVAKLGRVFDSLGLVVESIDYVRADVTGIVFARVLEIGAIPGADRIRRVLVDAGGSPEEIVCGATNFVVGDVVALATVGSALPGGREISARTVRGATSNGMLCSPVELGLSSDGEGLLILARTGSSAGALPSSIELGARAEAFLGLVDDVVFDLAIEPNRPDAYSIVGVARDVAARLSLPFSIPEPIDFESPPPANELASVEVRAPERCSQLLGRVLTGLSAFSSEPIVMRRLGLCGMRPIHPVVDASNYVMLELGQPTHPYDVARLSGSGIAVRLARPGERLVTLDGVEHALDPDDLLICDAADHPVGLAGIMGGESSEISAATHDVLLEVAEFEPLGIGRAAARHGVRTEASARFWRGVDPEGLSRAADRFAELVVNAALAFGASAPTVASGILADRPTRFSPTTIDLSVAFVNARLGTALTASEITSYLTPIGFSVERSGDVLAVTVPSFRPDCRLPVDLTEEVARHYGYEKITPASIRSPFVGRLSERQRVRRTLRLMLVAAGVDEAWTSPIVDPALEAAAGATAPLLELRNPIVAGESALRSHLLPGLLGALSFNERHRNTSIRLFELGAVFFPPGSHDGDDVAGNRGRPREQEQLGVLLARDGDDAWSAVRLLDELAAVVRLDPSAFRLDQERGVEQRAFDNEIALGLHATRKALVRTDDGRVIGAVGEVAPQVLASFGIAAPRVGWLAVDLEAFSNLPRRARIAEPVTRFPTSDIDLSFVLTEEHTAAELGDLLTSSLGERAEFCHLADVYRGPGMVPGARSLTFQIRLRAFDHTLSEAEIAEARASAIEAARRSLGAELRA